MKYIAFLLLFLLSVLESDGCTTAVISGKATADGRPLLYKHRDTGSLENKLMAFSDGKFDYIGIVNSADKGGKEVWGGYNETGFAIMNSASYNLNATDIGNEEREGIVMKMALQQCVTLADFERLLDSLPKPMHLSANFGVIDVQGGAAYYETGDFGYKKYDVNDLSIAPDGYLIRTNYSVSGDEKRQRGVSRYKAAELLFSKAFSANNLSCRFLLKDVSRSLLHGLTGKNLNQSMPDSSQDEAFAPFRDFIPRYSTASVIVVQGTREDEKVDMATLWTILGSPLTTPAIPVWLNKDGIYPSSMVAGETGNARLCNMALILKKQLFNMEIEEGKDYINLAALISKDGKGILQRIFEMEDVILKHSEETMEKWRNGGRSSADLRSFCRFADNYIEESYCQLFQICADL